MIGLTAQQQRLHDYLARFVSANRIAPSMRQMSAHMDGLAISSVHRMLMALEERGHIRRIPNRARAIEILDHSSLHAVPTSDLIAELTRRGEWRDAA